MAVEKMSLSFVSRLAKTIRKEAKREGVSVSAWVARAAEREAKLAALQRAVATFEADRGEINADEQRWAGKVWPA